MTYTCADIKFITAIMRHILCISFFPSPPLSPLNQPLQATAASYNDIQISISSSLPLPRLACLFGCFFFSFRYNRPKWKWKSAVLQSVSQLANSPFKENHKQRFCRSEGFCFFINPQGGYLGFLCIFCTHF